MTEKKAKKLIDVAPLQPDLELGSDTDLEEIEAIWHSGHTALYTLPTIIQFLQDNGIDKAVSYLAVGALKHDMEPPQQRFLEKEEKGGSER